MPIYMKYEGIVGTAKGKHNGWIELESAQIGGHRNVTLPTGSGTNREANAPSVSEIVITKFQDDSSTHLFRETLAGEGKKVTIDFVRDDKDAPYLSIEIENVLISSYSVSGHGGDSSSRPMESLSLNFTKISFSTKATSASTDPKHAQDRVQWDMAISNSTP